MNSPSKNKEFPKDSSTYKLSENKQNMNSNEASKYQIREGSYNGTPEYENHKSDINLINSPIRNRMREDDLDS